MKLNELTGDERTVMMGMLREVIQADGEYSREEQDAITVIRAGMGPDEFDQATAAATRFRTRAALAEAAKKVTRVEARVLILNELIAIAAADGVDEEEERPLNWLTRVWPDALTK